MSTLQRQVELIDRSTKRMNRAVAMLGVSPDWRRFLRRETWVHLKLSAKLWWIVWRQKED